MNTNTVERLKLLSGDVLILPTQVKQSDIIHTLDSRMEDMNAYTVVKTATDCKFVKAGDDIVIEFAKHTQPFLVDSKTYAITNERNIITIIE